MTQASKPVYIEGVAIEISWQDRSRNLSELIFSTTRRAIDDAGKGLDGIDSVVLGAHDLVDGRSLSSMVTAPAAGAYLRDETRFSDDGAAAFAAAVTRVEAGESNRCIVAAWGRTSEHDVEAVSRVLFDPFFGRPLGLEELDISAMRAQAWIQNGGDRSAYAQVLRQRAQAVARNPRALQHGGRTSAERYPLVVTDLPVWADVVVAVVLTTEKTAVRLAGMGQSSEPYWAGDRKLTDMFALRQAAQRALEEAKIEVADLSVAEIDGMSLYDEVLGLEAVGLATQGQGMNALAYDARCNPSGGGSAGYCAPAMGLVRIVEATLQLRGSAGEPQVPDPRWALATGSSVVAGQTQTAIVLEAV